jgi:hypothetical protein
MMMFTKITLEQKFWAIADVDANVESLSVLTCAEQDAVGGAAVTTEYAILIGL